MTMKLIQMRNINLGSVWLYKSEHSREWTCTAEGAYDGTAFKCQGNGETPDEAINATYAKWLRITDAVPEFVGRLPAPLAEDAHDGDSMIQPQAPTTFDDIPF